MMRQVFKSFLINLFPPLSLHLLGAILKHGKAIVVA